uniref:Uncharacterized protein n=1 Tax=Ficus carica TaxID=3494 RepID=A0AA88E8W5_FICCA|nr:hypothetical protein TIFTF001_039312 [Ficus carica]GMN70275.1 hypothetical protein TIFTF001_039318 [Ficus carica]
MKFQKLVYGIATVVAQSQRAHSPSPRPAQLFLPRAQSRARGARSSQARNFSLARAIAAAWPQSVTPACPRDFRAELSQPQLLLQLAQREFRSMFPSQARAFWCQLQPGQSNSSSWITASLILSPSWLSTSNRLIYQPGWRICCIENPLACCIHGYILRAPQEGSARESSTYQVVERGYGWIGSSVGDGGVAARKGGRGALENKWWSRGRQRLEPR